MQEIAASMHANTNQHRHTRDNDFSQHSEKFPQHIHMSEECEVECVSQCKDRCSLKTRDKLHASCKDEHDWLEEISKSPSSIER